jgi:hypothetical protein
MPATTQDRSWLRREGTRLRLRTAFIVWGLLAIAGWVAVLVPAYVLIDHGPEIVQTFFGDDADDMSPRDVDALGRIAPASGGKSAAD